MVEFLNTSKAYAEIEDIVGKAQRNLVLISPYIQITGPLLTRLKDAGGKRGVGITIVCRKKDLKPAVKSELQEVENLKFRFLENLHAKCFHNEKSMVISSLNLYDFSQRNNAEMGILLRAGEDGGVFKDALAEAEYIVRTATEDAKVRAVSGGKKNLKTSAKGGKRQIVAAAKPGSKSGHCVRCKKKIPLNAEKPFCRDCWERWAEYENPEFPEKYCHSCGKRESTTKKSPVCVACV